MPQRRRISGPPSGFLASGSWPDGRLRKDAPVAARYAQHISQRLMAAANESTISGLARSADVARSTVRDIIYGNTWPDVVSLAKLEEALRLKLWPDH